jgi:hypothetical protein
MVSALEQNAADLEGELAWLARLIDARFKLYFDLDAAVAAGEALAPPDLSGSDSPYAAFLRETGCGFAERVALVLALAPHIRPQLLDVFFTRNQTFDRRFTEFGGARKGADGDFWPTGETLAFIIAGTDLAQRFRLRALFDSNHVFVRRNVLRALPASADEPAMKAPLHISEDALTLFTAGEVRRPVFGAHFPAQLVETRLDWDDLVLHPATRQGLAEIESWIEHGRTLMRDWQMSAKLRPGYRSLFHGPPGTGKTMTACLVGKSTGRDVYRVDLSMVVSKYIGETEKNLALVFDQAEGRNWILFFDEADALFGKRSEVKDSHDRYANIEVSYLLQRMEAYSGLAILTTNHKAALDSAFQRRIRFVVHFPFPDQAQREIIWRAVFPAGAPLNGIDYAKLARLDVPGGTIRNIAMSAAFLAAETDVPIGMQQLLRGAQMEATKRERPYSDAETRGWV